MATAERVTVTLPNDLARDRRRRAELRRSLQNPHPEGADLAENGFEEWTRGLPEEDIEALVDSSAGKLVRWIPG
jgi:hypothetical protein